MDTTSLEILAIDIGLAAVLAVAFKRLMSRSLLHYLERLTLFWLILAVGVQYSYYYIEIRLKGNFGFNENGSYIWPSLIAPAIGTLLLIWPAFITGIYCLAYVGLAAWLRSSKVIGPKTEIYIISITSVGYLVFSQVTELTWLRSW